MVIKIDNYEEAADLFTFPNNPQTFDDAIEGNMSFTNMPYQRFHIAVGGGGAAPKKIVLVGHFNGASKEANYRSLSKHFQENHKLKKLYWETDKFYLGLGALCKKTHTGGRTNFIDYVASFTAIFTMLFGDTQRTSGTNEGNVTTFIEEISGTVTSGASDVTVADALGNSWKIPAAALTTDQAIVVKMMSMIDSGRGVYVSELNYATIAGTQTKRIVTEGGLGLIQLAAGANMTTITITNLTSPVVKFRDGYSA